jgi:hypothetical protein
MMRNKLLIICLLILITQHISAQNSEPENTYSHNLEISIPDVAIIGIAGPEGNGSSILLTPDISNLEAGEAVDYSTATNNSLWLNYTSITDSPGNGNGKPKPRTIKAEIDQNLPAAFDLLLEVGTVSSGSGQTGTATQGKITLKKGPSTVVEDIGSCFTENGEGKGHRLTYSLGIKENQLDKVMAAEYSVTVTYTISEK